MDIPKIAVVIPHYQRSPGLLAKALASAFGQSIAHAIHVYVIDDASPVPAQVDIDAHPEFPRDQLTVVRTANGGAGAARNKALDLVAAGTELVAFLDSDDEWQPAHLANAVAVLACGHDAYFSDWWSFNFPEQTNFQRIGAPDLAHCPRLLDAPPAYALGVTPLEHIVSDGGGVIQTSTVVYRYARYPQLRFREQFYNGQDFFFWMDLGVLGATFAFSTEVDCHNGEGINIYQSAGWGTERSLHRLRNELLVWTSVRRIYALDERQRANNRATIRNLQGGVIRDLLYRVRRGKGFSARLLVDIVRFDPMFVLVALWLPCRILGEKLFGAGAPQAAAASRRKG